MVADIVSVVALTEQKEGYWNYHKMWDEFHTQIFTLET